MGGSSKRFQSVTGCVFRAPGPLSKERVHSRTDTQPRQGPRPGRGRRHSQKCVPRSHGHVRVRAEGS